MNNNDIQDTDMSFVENSTTLELFQFLQKVDPISAQRFHPSDRRKIQGKVELYLRTGRPASELYKEQKDSGVDVRWDTLIFWVWSERDVLNARLDRRVDKMIEMGLEQECRELYHVSQKTKAPVTSGIFQAIGIITSNTAVVYLFSGYREFVPVIEAGSQDDVSSLRQAAIQQMKTNTRTYVRRQLSWINNKLIPLCAQQGRKTPIYILDATDPTNWNTKVLAPALAIAQGSFVPQLTFV
jgi:tRNA dimethylallyltransferase